MIEMISNQWKELIAIFGFVTTLFVLYRLIVKNKDATIEVKENHIALLNEKVSALEDRSPDILVELFKKRADLLEEELIESENNQKYTTDQIESLELQLENANIKIDKAEKSRSLLNELNLAERKLSKDTEELDNFISISDTFHPKTPEDIEHEFEKILREEIPFNWKYKNKIDLQYNVTRVLVNKVRFSTFVIFTDGKRILFHKRHGEEKFDAFSSIQFENRTINNKLQNPRFLSSRIIRSDSISGVAVEENFSQIDNETAIYLGVCIYLYPEDLDLAKDENTIIFPMQGITELKKNLFTSKASLGIQHLKKESNKRFNLTG